MLTKNYFFILLNMLSLTAMEQQKLCESFSAEFFTSEPLFLDYEILEKIDLIAPINRLQSSSNNLSALEKTYAILLARAHKATISYEELRAQWQMLTKNQKGVITRLAIYQAVQKDMLALFNKLFSLYSEIYNIHADCFVAKLIIFAEIFKANNCRKVLDQHWLYYKKFQDQIITQATCLSESINITLGRNNRKGADALINNFIAKPLNLTIQ